MFKYTFKRYLFKILNITVQKGIQEKIHKMGTKTLFPTLEPTWEKTANENPRIPKLSSYKKDFTSTRASTATNYIYFCVFVSSFITIAATSPKAKTYII